MNQSMNYTEELIKKEKSPLNKYVQISERVQKKKENHERLKENLRKLEEANK